MLMTTHKYSASIVAGNINIRLTNSDSGVMANEIQGINVCYYLSEGLIGGEFEKRSDASCVLSNFFFLIFFLSFL
jgi:hypothetical protein